ncbi:MAG: MoaD/ThiS family protein [Zestosphaera sp.]
MSVEVEALGVLKGRLGGKVCVSMAGRPVRLKDFLKQLRSELPDLREAVEEDGTPTTSYLIFINGVDYRLLGGLEYRLRDKDEISLVPISHGG